VKISLEAVLGSHSVSPGKKVEVSGNPLTEEQGSQPFQPAVKELGVATVIDEPKQLLLRKAFRLLAPVSVL
jgi:hypothetical protein